MPPDKTLRGLRPVRYLPDPTYRYTWYAHESAPKPYLKYYAVFDGGLHVGEMFLGKSGKWFGVMFGRVTVRTASCRSAMMVMVGMGTSRS